MAIVKILIACLLGGVFLYFGISAKVYDGWQKEAGEKKASRNRRNMIAFAIISLVLAVVIAFNSLM